MVTDISHVACEYVLLWWLSQRGYNHGLKKCGTLSVQSLIEAAIIARLQILPQTAAVDYSNGSIAARKREATRQIVPPMRHGSGLSQIATEPSSPDLRATKAFHGSQFRPPSIFAFRSLVAIFLVRFCPGARGGAEALHDQVTIPVGSKRRNKTRTVSSQGRAWS